MQSSESLNVWQWNHTPKATGSQNLEMNAKVTDSCQNLEMNAKATCSRHNVEVNAKATCSQNLDTSHTPKVTKATCSRHNVEMNAKVTDSQNLDTSHTPKVTKVTGSQNVKSLTPDWWHSSCKHFFSSGNEDCSCVGRLCCRYDIWTALELHWLHVVQLRAGRVCLAWRRSSHISHMWLQKLAFSFCVQLQWHSSGCLVFIRLEPGAFWHVPSFLLVCCRQNNIPVDDRKKSILDDSVARASWMQQLYALACCTGDIDHTVHSSGVKLMQLWCPESLSWPPLDVVQCVLWSCHPETIGPESLQSWIGPVLVQSNHHWRSPDVGPLSPYSVASMRHLVQNVSIGDTSWLLHARIHQGSSSSWGIQSTGLCPVVRRRSFHPVRIPPLLSACSSEPTTHSTRQFSLVQTWAHTLHAGQSCKTSSASVSRTHICAVWRPGTTTGAAAHPVASCLPRSASSHRRGGISQHSYTYTTPARLMQGSAPRSQPLSPKLVLHWWMLDAPAHESMGRCTSCSCTEKWSKTVSSVIQSHWKVKQNSQFCHPVVAHKNEPHVLSLCIEDRQTIKRRNATFCMVLRNVLLVAGVWIHFRKLGHAEQLNQNFSFLHEPPTKPSSPVCSAHPVVPSLWSWPPPVRVALALNAFRFLLCTKRDTWRAPFLTSARMWHWFFFFLFSHPVCFRELD